MTQFPSGPFFIYQNAVGLEIMRINPSILQFQDRLSDLKLEAVLLNSSEITPSVNLSRLSGFSGSDATLVITQEQAHLFTDGRYKIQSRSESPGLRIHVTKNKIVSIARFIQSRRIRNIGLEGTRISYEFINQLSKKCPGVEFSTINRSVLDEFRMIKTAEEVDKIRAAAHLASSACIEIVAAGLRGKTESEVGAELETLFRKRGASGPSFATIVASGLRSALPHGSATGKIINSGDLVIIDYGCKLSGYCSDETVTCIVDKAPGDGQQKMYQAVKDAHDRAIEALKPGIQARDVDKIARDTISQAGYGRYFVHSLGHGVGMEVHEAPYLSPRSADRLESGMVFTIEPGVYVEEVGGIRLESLVHLKETGPEILSLCPKDLIAAA